MNFFTKSLGIALLSLVVYQPTALAQAPPFFTDPLDAAVCDGSGATALFTSTLFNNFSTPFVFTSFTASSSDVTISLVAPPAGATLDISATGASGADYELTVQSIGSTGFYNLFLSVSNIDLSLGGEQYRFSGSYLNPGPTTLLSNRATLVVNTPLELYIDDPISLAAVLCVGDDLAIDADASDIPDSYQWYRNGLIIPGATSQDLMLDSVTTLQSGFYELEATYAGCPDALSNTVVVTVSPGVKITAIDMAAKTALDGQNAQFTAKADNVDGTSTYTWLVDGNPFIASGSLPDTIMVSGNAIVVDSIINTGSGPTSLTSKLSVTNLGGGGAYTANVQLKVTNNSLCQASLGTQMSIITQVFPVEWLSFSAKGLESGDVLLNWATGSEVNNEKFVVERSTDGRLFAAVGEVKSSGDSRSAAYYDWTDKDVRTGTTYYYRITQYDYDGQHSSTSVVLVTIGAAKELILGPATVLGDEVRFQVETPQAGSATAQILDARGVLVQQTSLQLEAGAQAIDFQLPIPSGFYVLRIMQDGRAISRSFVK